MSERLQRIGDLARDVRETRRAARNAQARFQRAVIAAWRDGASQTDIARAAHMSRQRISKIIDDKKRP